MRSSAILCPLLLSAFVSAALARPSEGPRRMQRRHDSHVVQDNYGGLATGPGPEVPDPAPLPKNDDKSGSESQESGSTKPKNEDNTNVKGGKGGDDGKGGDVGSDGDDGKGGHKEDGENVPDDQGKPKDSDKPKKCKAKGQGGKGGSSGSGSGSGNGSGSGTPTDDGSGSKSSGHFTVGDVKCDSQTGHCVYLHDKCYTSGPNPVDGVYPPAICSKQDDAGMGVGKCVFPDNSSTVVVCPGNSSINVTFTHEHSFYEEGQWTGYAIWSNEKSSAGFIDTPAKDTEKAGADLYVWGAGKPKDTSKWSSGGDKGSKSGNKGDDHKGNNYDVPPPVDNGSQTPTDDGKVGKDSTTTPPKNGGTKGQGDDKGNAGGKGTTTTPPAKDDSNEKTDGESQKPKDKGTGSGTGGDKGKTTTTTPPSSDGGKKSDSEGVKSSDKTKSKDGGITQGGDNYDTNTYADGGA